MLCQQKPLSQSFTSQSWTHLQKVHVACTACSCMAQGPARAPRLLGSADRVQLDVAVKFGWQVHQATGLWSIHALQQAWSGGALHLLMPVQMQAITSLGMIDCWSGMAGESLRQCSLMSSTWTVFRMWGHRNLAATARMVLQGMVRHGCMLRLAAAFFFLANLAGKVYSHIILTHSNQIDLACGILLTALSITFQWT